MADISAKAAVNSLTNDVKTRTSSPDNTADLSGSQFVDVMIARLSTVDSRNDDQESSTNVNDVNSNANSTNNARDTSVLGQMKNVREKAVAQAQQNDQDDNTTDASTISAAATVAQPSMTDIKEKIKARIKEIASTNDVPVKNDASLKALKKVAAFLLKAADDGQLALPPQLVQKLQDFLAKGDDLKAFDVTNFMQDFAQSFKSMIVAMNAQGPASTDDGLKWPQDILDQMKDLGMTGLADGSKDVSTFDAVRVVKALVNASEKAAIDTLDDKIKAAVLPQDRGDILVSTSAATKNAKVNADAQTAVKVSTPQASEKTSTQTSAQQTAAQAAATNAAGSLLGIAQDTNKPQNNGNKSSLQGGLPIKGDLKADLKDSAAKGAALPPSNNTATLNAALRVQLASAASLPSDVASATDITSATSGVTNQNILDNLNNVASPTSGPRFAAALAAAAQPSAGPSEATQQVLVQLQARGNKPGSLTIQLTPAELGRVDVRLTTDRDGTVRTVIAAEKPETLALLQKDSALLEKSLQQAGINANAGNMSFNLREQRQSGQSDSGRKRFARSDLEDTTTKEVALNVNQVGIFSDDRVNYHA